MIVAIASGKGGTGKTLVATGLARVARAAGWSEVHLVDCDVEEPNAHLFLRPQVTSSEEVTLPVPQVDGGLCDGCGRCAQVCAFHALAVVRGRVLAFPELCHGCGSCARQCPRAAIHEVPKHLGRVERGSAGDIHFAQGILEVGEAMATPVIRQLKRTALSDISDAALALLDAPPGNACPVVETLRGSGFALLVTEPTPFGLHDLQIAVQVARDELGLPVGVVVNRDGVGDDGVDRFCASANVPILLRIPFDRRIAEAYSVGTLWVDVLPEYREPLRSLLSELKASCGVAP